MRELFIDTKWSICRFALKEGAGTGWRSLSWCKIVRQPLGRWEFLPFVGAGWGGRKYWAASPLSPDAATRKLHRVRDVCVLCVMCITHMSVLICKPSRRVYFVLWRNLFASSYRWKVGVQTVVSAAVSGEDRAATITPAFTSKNTFSYQYWRAKQF